MLPLIWDLDGTLIDSSFEILHHLELAIREAALDGAERIAPITIGAPLDVMLNDAFPAKILNAEKLNEVIGYFRRRYDNSDFSMTKPFAGIETIITDTAHFTHHIVTNKPDLATKRILEKLGWTNKIASVSTPYTYQTNGAERKTKTELFAMIIAKYPSAALIGIGDTNGDCVAAQANGIPSIGVLWGTGTPEELRECDYIVQDMAELHKLLAKMIPLTACDRREINQEI